MSRKECNACKVLKEFDEFGYCGNNKDNLRNKCRSCTNEDQSNERKTKEGLIKLMYYSLRSSSVYRKHKMPSFSRIEFYKWILKQMLFDELFQNWVNSDYKTQLRPSIDRKNDYKPYSFSNMQLMTWGENKKKSSHDKRNGINTKGLKAVLQYDLNGNFIKEYYSQSYAFRETGCTQAAISLSCLGKVKSPKKFIWRFKN